MSHEFMKVIVIQYKLGEIDLSEYPVLFQG